MPPVPRSCADIMRSASAGPRRMRTSPNATIARMKPAAVIRNSAMVGRSAQCPREEFLVCRHLRCHRLVHIEAMHKKCSVFVGVSRQRAGHQARQREKRVASRARRQSRRHGHEARAQRQPRIKRAPRDIDPRNQRLTWKAQYEPGNACWRQARSAGGQEAQTRPGRARNRNRRGRKVSGIEAGKNQPKDKKSCGANECGGPQVNVAGRTAHGVTPTTVALDFLRCTFTATT